MFADKSIRAVPGDKGTANVAILARRVIDDANAAGGFRNEVALTQRPFFTAGVRLSEELFRQRVNAVLYLD